MLIDARTLPANHTLESDVCIIGAGAAGITLAREFAGQGFRVALFESGGIEFDPDTQALYAGKNLGRPYFTLDTCRLRFLGGSTNHWGGTCRPLDAIDFEPRDWVPNSGWPIQLSDLEPYYPKAQQIVELGPYDYRVSEWLPNGQQLLSLSGDRLSTGIFQQSPPTRFGAVYRADLERDDNVTTFLNANVVEIQTTANAREVTGLDVRTLTGNRIAVTGKHFIVATGGIEVPRLLLASNRTARDGLGNEHGLVGRFFMDHPIAQAATIALSDSSAADDLYRRVVKHGGTAQAFFSPTPEFQREQRLLNFGARPDFVSWAKVSRGVSSYQVLREAIREGEIPDELLDHIINVITDIDDVYASRQKGPESHKVLSLRYWQEPTPDPDSRVTLATETDALGMPLANLNWVLAEADKDNMSRALHLIGEELGQARIGRLQLTYDIDKLWDEQIAGSFHHMGTTRMSDEPELGVVDRHLRVHGMSNLHVAGSSVFPTSGHANPTLTLVALSLRLADRVKELMK